MQWMRSRPKTVLAAFVLLLALHWLWSLATSSPGGEDTVDQLDRVVPFLPRPKTAVDRLRAAWDSEATADWPVAGLLANLSQQAYLAPVEADAAYRDLGFPDVEPFTDASMIGYVVSAEDVAVIVFRGADDPADWNEKLHIDGVITFGQPMVARPPSAEHLDQLLLGRYAHFVNEADIVTRVPPGHSHCGSLVWFTEDGIRRSRPKRIEFRSQPGEHQATDHREIEPLSEEEFQQLQSGLRNPEPERLPDGTPVMRGQTPWIRDHSMSLYLDRIRGVVDSRSHVRIAPNRVLTSPPQAPVGFTPAEP